MKTQEIASPATARSGFARVLQAGFWICVGVAVLVVIRRLTALGATSAGSSRPGELGNLDATFAAHIGLTLAHITPALCLVLIVPVVVFGRASLARRVEPVLFPLGVVVGGTAYAMSVYSVGGWLERSAVLVFNTWFLFCLVRAWKLAGLGDPERKRRWLLRSIATLLGIATTRPVVGVFFATSRLTRLQPNQFFGMAFWIGFSINVALIEMYLRQAWRPRHDSAA